MNIQLVPPSASFATVFHKWRGEKDSVRFNPLKPMSLDQAQEILASSPKILSPLQDASTHRWFILVQDEVVGVVSLTEVNNMMSTGQIGYTIGANYQGRGIATIGLQLWTKLLFESTNLRKLTAMVNEHNGASLRVLEKCGYKKEGFLREHYLIHGEPSNQVLFGLLRSDWTSDVMK